MGRCGGGEAEDQPDEQPPSEWGVRRAAPCGGRHADPRGCPVVTQWLPIDVYERRHIGAGGGRRQAEFGGRGSPCSDAPAPDPVPREGKVGTGAVLRPDRSPHNRGDPGLQLRLVTARGDERQHISRVTDQRRPLTPSPVL